AWRQARLRLGNYSIQKERTREMDVVGWLETVRADVAYGLRQLKLNPGFASSLFESNNCPTAAGPAARPLSPAALPQSGDPPSRPGGTPIPHRALHSAVPPEISSVNARARAWSPSSNYEYRSTRATPRVSRAQLSCSSANCFRPRAVMA